VLDFYKQAIIASQYKNQNLEPHIQLQIDALKKAKAKQIQEGLPLAQYNADNIRNIKKSNNNNQLGLN